MLDGSAAPPSVELLRTHAALTVERTATRARSCLGENMVNCAEFFFPLSETNVIEASEVREVSERLSSIRLQV